VTDEDATVKPYAVVDLDGVLADVTGRLHHLEGARKNWPAFFAGIPKDSPYPEGFAVARELVTGHDLVYLSGRPEHTRAVSEEWLRRHDAPRARLLLRRDGDRRPARILKVAQLQRLQRERPVAVLVDDDPAVCQAAREAGFHVFQATWGRRQPTLYDAQERLGQT
jgi:phosphoglycolate phosphatase-like HAD superfamily hydrolase